MRPKARPYAIRKPKHVSFENPGDAVQINTLTLNLAPGRTVKQFDAGACLRAGRRPGPGDVFAKWTVAKPYAQTTTQTPSTSFTKSPPRCHAHQGYPDRGA